MSQALRQVLKAVDGSAESIQKAASSMMKHYDTTAAVAITEWRNVLSTARPQEFLPLLYVCNEVLQISKRNRGSNFLEGFSGILGQALQHICRTDPSLTEKVRRTVKIWGDRRVFSARFVQEVLSGLEAYRDGGGAGSAQNLPTKPRRRDSEDSDSARFSPPAVPPKKPDKKMEKANGDDSEDDIMQILEQDEDAVHEDDDDDDDIFASGDKKLEFDIDLDKVGTQPATPRKSVAKRRRSSMESTGSASSVNKRRRRRPVQSIVNLVDTLTHLSTLQQNSEYSQLALQKIDTVIQKQTPEELEQLVGDELQLSFRQVQDFLKQIQDQRKELYGNAQERHTIEQEAIGYVPWLEKALQHDDDDIQFCDKLEQEILSFSPVHVEIRKARDLRRAQEQRRQEEEAERERNRKEQEEAERFRRAALQRQTEGGVGLVWNPSTREYQEVNTEESWRD
jgi:hypothetical protein